MEISTNQIHQDSIKKTFSNYLDSIYIERDTLIHGEVYYKMKVNTCLMGGGKFLISYVRNINGVLVDHYGEIIFSSNASSDVIDTDTSLVLSDLYITEFLMSEMKGVNYSRNWHL